MLLWADRPIWPSVDACHMPGTAWNIVDGGGGTLALTTPSWAAVLQQVAAKQERVCSEGVRQRHRGEQRQRDTEREHRERHRQRRLHALGF